MHSVTSNAVARCFIYSVYEVKTGEIWIDGKPIYRLVVQGGIATTGTFVEIGDMSAYNVAQMVEMGGVFTQSGTGYQIDIGNYASGLHYNYPSARKISLYTSWAGSFNLIFKYTKTTD